MTSTRRLASVAAGVTTYQPCAARSEVQLQMKPELGRQGFVDWRERQPSVPRKDVPTDVLTETQVDAYHRDGYLLVSGLIPEGVAEQAESTMWRLCGLGPTAHPETWLEPGLPPVGTVSEQQGGGSAASRLAMPPELEEEGVDVLWHKGQSLISYMGSQNVDLMACATDRYLGAQAQLLGMHPSELHPPQSAHSQNKLPRPGEERRDVTPHVDGIPKVFDHDTFPGPFNITSLLFLNDVQGEEGGGTRVWPGSARKIRELADSDHIKYDKLWKLVKDVPALDLGEPIQLVPKRGDVLFWSHLLGHNGTQNTGTVPRLCMRFFCSCQACFGRWQKSDEWGHWCPYGQDGQGPFDGE